MANDGATFYFDTNIEETVNRVVSGLGSISSATAKIHGGEVKSPLEGLDKKVAAEIRKAKKEVGQLNELFKGGGIDSGTLQSRYQQIVSKLSTEIGRLGKKQGIDLDVVLTYSKKVVQSFAKVLKNEVEAAFKGTVLTPELKARIGKRSPEARVADVSAGYNGPDLKAENTRIKKASRKTAAAEEQSAAATQEKATADKASAAASKREAKAQEKAASKAEKRAEAGQGSAQSQERLAATSEAAASAGNRWVFATDRSTRAETRLAVIIEKLEQAAAERLRRYEAEGAIAPKPIIAQGSGLPPAIFPLPAPEGFRAGLPRPAVPQPAIGAGDPRLAIGGGRRRLELGQRGDTSGSALDITRLESEQVAFLRSLIAALRRQADAAEATAATITATAQLWSQIQREVQRVLQAARRRAEIEAGPQQRAITAGPAQRAIEARPAGSTGELALRRDEVTDLVRRTVGGELARTTNVRASARNIPRNTIYGPRGEEDPLFVYPPKTKKQRTPATNAENFDRLTNGTYENLAQNVIRLSKDFVAEIDGKTKRIYKVVDDGFEEVFRGGRDFFDQTQLLKTKLDRMALKAVNLGAGLDAVPTTRKQAKQNQRDLTPGGVFAEKVDPIGGPGARYVADSRESEERIFKRVKAGFVEIEKGSAEFEAQMRLLRAQQERQDPARKGLFNSFTSGFTSGSFFGGGGDKPQSLGQKADALARSAGTTAKYAALSTILFGLTGAFSAATAEVLDFEDSLTGMKVALEALNPDLEVNQTTISQLGDAAAIAGANVGQSMDLAAKAVRAFGDQTDGTQQSIDDLQVSYVNTASKLATISNTDIADAAGNLSAIGQAFDIPPESFNRILDVIAGAKQLGGGDAKKIGQGLANAAVALKEAGFSMEQGGAIISEIQKQTDQGGTLIASRLSKISSIIGGSGGKSAILQLNQSLAGDKKVDTTGTVKDQIQQLSAVYKDLGEAQRQQLVNSLGGTANARELIITLETANHLITEADKGFTGKGIDEFKARLADITATLRNIQGNIKVIIGTLGNSGALDPLFALAKDGLLPALQILRKMLETFNQIPRPLRTIAFTVGEIYLAFKLIQALSSKGFGGAARSLDALARPQAELARRELAEIEKKNAKKAAKKAGKQAAQQAAAAAVAAEEAEAAAAAAPAGRKYRVQNRQIGRLNPFTLSGTQSGTGGLLGREFKTAIKDVSLRQPVKDVLGSTREALRPANIRDAVTAGVKSGLRVPGSILNAPGLAAQQYSIQRSAGATRGQAFTSVAPTLSAAGTKIGGSFREGGAVRKLGSAIGVEGLATAGIAAIITANQKTKEILDLTEQAARLRQGDVANTPEALRDAAKNLQTSADDLHQASSGITGTLTNAFISVLTGHNASAEGQQTSKDLASGYQIAADRIDAAKKKGRDSGDLSSQVDLSSPDALTTSLQALSDAGYTATDRVNALTGKLHQMATSLTTDTPALTAANIETIGGGIIKRTTKEASDIKGLASDQNIRVDKNGQIDNRRSFHTGRKLGELQYKDLDPSRLGVESGRIAEDFLRKGGNVNNAAAMKELVETYRQSYIKLGLTPKDAKDAAAVAASSTRGQVNELTSGAAQENLVAYFKELDANLNAFGSDATLDPSAAGVGYAPPKKGAAPQSADLVAALAARDKLGENINTVQQTIDANKAKGDPASLAKAAQDEQLLAQAKLDMKRRNIDVAKQINANDRANFDLLQASAPPENLIANLDATGKEIDKELKKAKAVGDVDEIRRLKGEKAANKAAKIQARVAQKQAAGRAGIDVQDELGNANQDVIDAQTVLDDMDARGVNKQSTDYLNAKKKYDQAFIQSIKTTADLAISQRNIGAIPDSSLDTATRDLADANTILGTLLPGSIAYNNQLAQVYQKEQALAKTKLEVKSLNRQYKIDLTDPVAVAKEQATTAHEELARVKALKVGPDGKKIDPAVKAQLVRTAELNARSSDANEEATAFSQFLSNTQTADNLGRISHKTYLGMLQNRADQLTAELAAMKRGTPMYQQLTDQRDQLLQSIKAGADELSGVFNIGDIKVPTPYEVRKAIKDKDFGTILGANASTSTAGNVTTDNSTKNLTLNGVPIEEVLAMVKDLFGVKARTRAARKS